MLYPPKNPEARVGRSLLIKGPTYIDPLNPDPSLITLEAVAASLDAEIRWLNQTTRPISVTEHHLRCGRIAVARGGSLAQVLACMTHDTSKFLLRDIPGPLKPFVWVEVGSEFMRYAALEKRVRTAVVHALFDDEILQAEVLEQLQDDGGFVHSVDKDAETIEALKWQDGAEDWALRQVDSRAWMVADVPEECSWTEMFEEIGDVSPGKPEYREHLDWVVRAHLRLGEERWRW